MYSISQRTIHLLNLILIVEQLLANQTSLDDVTVADASDRTRTLLADGFHPENLHANPAIVHYQQQSMSMYRNRCGPSQRILWFNIHNISDSRTRAHHYVINLGFDGVESLRCFFTYLGSVWNSFAW